MLVNMIQTRESGARAAAGTVRTVRAGLLVLAALDAIVGGWAAAAPRSFYDLFPGGPFRWISPFGEYSMHLVADVGGAYLMMTALLVLAARSARRDVVRTALAAVLVQAVLHLSWHLMHLEMLVDPLNRAGLLVVLVVAAVLPVALLFPARRLPG